ncbi:FAD-dependent oxidoreductase [Parabacteroides pacaensis]|uniref:FAD-dependent oxidoreductase n=1 Tax=Parabacteroides pacaensis TaxID=2086575 RepID=UPI000D0F66AD|nr:FAD-dependent oxidoreductase [Parabacteroides pacaensis]
MKTQLLIVLLCFVSTIPVKSADLFVEAESFQQKGGWKVDQQFMDQMGSPYLLAHGMGVPVKNASTEVMFPKPGDYYIYVRTYNWTSPWKKGEGPGKFSLWVGDRCQASSLGTEGTAWMWQKAGKISIKELRQTLTLRDLTGFDGRCDAIYFTTEKNKIPPSDLHELTVFRRNALHFPDLPADAGQYDFVVIGGGIAGMCAAISSARLGLKVALINDRPVLGGNNSSEIRVHLGGRIESGVYKQLGNLIKEFGPVKGGNAQPAGNYEDEKKEEIINREKNITLFPNFRAFAVEKEGNKITAVLAQHIETGEVLSFKAPLYSDCTGDGTIGYLAGADYLMGRESRDQFQESTAPEKADKMTMGASVQWYSEDKGQPTTFPLFNYGVDFNHTNAEKVTMGEWTWETGMNYDQIKDFERIRDYGLLVVYSNWSYLKNEFTEDQRYKNLSLAWVAYIAGKRESRRLLGDHILTENDLRNQVEYPDATASTTWSIDLHYPDPKNSEHFPAEEFKSIAKHIPIHPYPIPYRCLYSRNVDNLFMAGRNISVTHVALGTVRVMRTTGMMGEVVGMAASLCKQYHTLPREIYQSYLDQLKALMQDGTGQKGLPNNQQYNEGATLGE